MGVSEAWLQNLLREMEASQVGPTVNVLLVNAVGVGGVNEWIMLTVAPCRPM